MAEFVPFKLDDRCKATLGDRTVDAVIVLASNNGISLVIGFEAILGSWAGMAPLMWSDERREFETLNGLTVRLEKTDGL